MIFFCGGVVGVRGFERSPEEKSAQYVTGSSSPFKNPTLG